MSRSFGVATFVVTAFFLAFSSCIAAAQGNAAPSRVELDAGWQVQSSAKVTQSGDAVSAAGFATTGWYATKLPATVVSTLVSNNILKDPYFGTNLRTFPAMSYPVGGNFSNTLMPVESPFLDPWWFRSEFQTPEDYKGKRVALHFDGINYRAELWLNGKRIADRDHFAGTYRTFEFDVTDALVPGPNALALEIFAPLPSDLAVTFVDWNPLPPDKDMGIWKDVYLTESGPAALRYPQVVTVYDAASDEAHLTVNVQVENKTSQPMSGDLVGDFDKDVKAKHPAFSKHISLQPNETQPVSIGPADAPALNVRHPLLWWPAQMGEPFLHDLHLEFRTGPGTSDVSDTKFGIRQITSEMTPQGARLFKINGRNILIRGAGWTPDMMLRTSAERQEQEIQYVKQMNLNTIRLEGKLENEHFFDLTDKYGILVMPGWCCCDLWEQWQEWRGEQLQTATDSLRDQAMRLRNHPSVIVWLYGSDNPPVGMVEQRYLDVLKQSQWPNPTLSSASAKPAAVTGASGVKMSGPYDWVPPNYWLTDTQHGGAFGFNTETSPGAAVPPIQSLRKFIPADHLWPIDDVWNYHAGGGEFKDIKRFADALDARYGRSQSAEDFARKSQWMTYEGERAMFEAYGRNKYGSTGVIQWMLNNAWPSLIWHLYDYYLLPGGGFFGTRKANEPLHIQYSYDDRSIVVVNSTQQAAKNLTVTAEVFDLQLNRKFSTKAKVDSEADSSQRVFVVPEMAGLTDTYFVKLQLSEGGGRVVSDNFYWLSTKPDTLDFAKSEWYVTPVTSYADFSALSKLPAATVQASSRNISPRKGGSPRGVKPADSSNNETTEITIRNAGSSLAFAVELRLVRAENGDDVLPALWDDNYITLMPGEKRTVRVSYSPTAGGSAPHVKLSGTNVAQQELAP